MATVRDTSIKVFYDLKDEGYINDRHLEILSYLSGFDDGVGATDREIASALGFDDPNMVRPRRKELLDLQLVLQGEKRPCDESGRTSYTWYKNSGFNRELLKRPEILKINITHPSLLFVVAKAAMLARKHRNAIVSAAEFSKGVYKVQVMY